MADGLFHAADGRKYFLDGEEVKGANNFVQHEHKAHHGHKKKHHKKAAGEPPAKQITDKEQKESKSMKEEEDNGKEIAEAQETMAKQEKAKAEAAAAAAAAAAEAAKAEAKAKEEAAAAAKAADEKRRTKADGLIHNDDGTRVDPATHLIVGGVNNHAQIKSTTENKSQSDEKTAAPVSTPKVAPTALAASKHGHKHSKKHHSHHTKKSEASHNKHHKSSHSHHKSSHHKSSTEK